MNFNASVCHFFSSVTQKVQIGLITIEWDEPIFKRKLRMAAGYNDDTQNNTMARQLYEKWCTPSIYTSVFLYTDTYLTWKECKGRRGCQNKHNRRKYEDMRETKSTERH